MNNKIRAFSLSQAEPRFSNFIDGNIVGGGGWGGGGGGVGGEKKKYRIMKRAAMGADLLGHLTELLLFSIFFHFYYV